MKISSKRSVLCCILFMAVMVWGGCRDKTSDNVIPEFVKQVNTLCSNKNRLDEQITTYIDDNYHSEGVIVNLADFTDFDWDRVMIFKYPTSAKEIEDELGVTYEKSLDLTSGIIFVLNDEIVYDEVFENDYDGPPHFFIYPQSEVNAKPNYRVFLKEEAEFVGKRNEHEDGAYYTLYSCLFSDSSSTIPEEYSETLEMYKKIANSMISGDFEKDYNEGKFPSPNSQLDYEWNCMLIELNFWNLDSMEKTNDSFDYVLKDLNGDGTQELIFMLQDYTILAVFSIYDGEANLLDAYWTRHRCLLLESGELYTLSCGGAQDFEYAIQKVDEEGKMLSYIVQFGSDGGNYYKIVGENKTIISETEFEELRMAYPKNLHTLLDKLG